MLDAHETLENGNNESQAEQLDTPRALDTLREIASQQGSSELLEIAELVATSQDRGEAGAVALDNAVSLLADIDTAKIAEATPESNAGDIGARLDKVFFYLVNERLKRQTEIDRDKNARQVVNGPSAGIGDSPELRIQAARLALEKAVNPVPTADSTLVNDAPDRFFSPNSDPLVKLQSNFAIPTGEDASTFSAGFNRETQVAMSNRLIEIASKTLDALPEGQKLPDTVLAVIGNQPAMAQEMLGFMGSEIASSDEIMRMAFTDLANRTGIELPDDILSKLEKPTPNNPPPPG